MLGFHHSILSRNPEPRLIDSLIQRPVSSALCSGLHLQRTRAISNLADMPTFQPEYDDAMFEFSQANYDSAIERFKSILAQDPQHFDAQLSLGMAYYRKGDYAAAIAEGHKAEQMRPNDQLVHTNLSLFYMKSGDKKTAEHHGLQARIASWKGNMAPPSSADTVDPELQMAKPKPPPVKFPEMPWKKKSGSGKDGANS